MNKHTRKILANLDSVKEVHKELDWYALLLKYNLRSFKRGLDDETRKALKSELKELKKENSKMFQKLIDNA